MSINNEKGIAFAMTLFTFIILISLTTLFIQKTVHENRMATMERELAKAHYAANAGAHYGLDTLDNLINNYLLNTIASSSPSGVIANATSYAGNNDGIGWLLYAVRNNNTPVLLQNGNNAEYPQSGSIGDQNYSFNIVISEKTDPVTVNTDTWDFPYNFKIESSASSEGLTQNVVINGDFTVRVQKDNFAKYALFTNSQSTPSGTKVWFTNKTNFAGPLHTNDRFNIALNPSGTFDGSVSQVQQTARFYNNGSNILLNNDHNGTTDVPTFNSNFNRDVSTVTLSSATQKQDIIDQAQGGQTYASNGIYLTNNGTNLSGGIYIRGNSTIDMAVDGNNNAVYTITQGSSTKVVTVDLSSQQTTVQDINAGSSTTYNGLPDGMDNVGTIIYTEGKINSLGGTVQQDTALTISSNDDIIITDNVTYSSYTPSTGTPGAAGYIPPNANGTNNILGLVTWSGDVRVGSSAPNNVNIHGTILSQDGILQVDNYDSGSPRGTATLLGGVITDNYGAFGQFNGSTGQQISGYGRNFVYDERMQVGTAPPYFPTLNTFVAFTNDLTDKLVWQQGD